MTSNLPPPQTMTLVIGSRVDWVGSFPSNTPILGWNITLKVFAPNGITLITKTVGTGIALTNTVTGQTTVSWNASDTAGLAPGNNYSFFMDRTDVGSETPLANGTLILAKG